MPMQRPVSLRDPYPSTESKETSMRMIASALSAVVISTSVAAAAPAANTNATPAHQSAAAMKIHAKSRDRVEAIQTALNSKDDAKLAVDGVYGPKTRAAVEDFQKKNDLKATGRADHATLHKLDPQKWT